MTDGSSDSASIHWTNCQGFASNFGGIILDLMTDWYYSKKTTTNPSLSSLWNNRMHESNSVPSEFEVHLLVFLPKSVSGSKIHEIFLCGQIKSVRIVLSSFSVMFCFEFSLISLSRFMLIIIHSYLHFF